MKPTHLSLFSGIGGLDLAAEVTGFETVGQCEWADYPTMVLEKHWPNVPRWRDIRTLTGEDFRVRTGLRTVDVISGGFPCQPFSVAGKQKGRDDERYLWPEMLRVIRELAPSWVVGENVPGILRIAARDVVESLEREGYHVAVFDFEAAAVGAPHRRERIAFVAHSDGAGLQMLKQHEASDAEKRQPQPCRSTVECCQNVADANAIRCQWFGYVSEEGRDADKEHYAFAEGDVVSDAASAERERSEKPAKPYGGPDLQTVISEQETGGQLNPTWVEWLMGYPIGWTEL